MAPLKWSCQNNKNTSKRKKTHESKDQAKFFFIDTRATYESNGLLLSTKISKKAVKSKTNKRIKIPCAITKSEFAGENEEIKKYEHEFQKHH